MQSSEENNWSIPFIIIALLAIAAGVLFYVTSDFYKQKHPQGRKEFDVVGRPVHSTATAEQILLTKNEKLIVGRSCLVYKGIDKKIILVDHYLLDLDPEQAYEKRFLKKDAKKEIVLGEGRYRLLSVNNQHLILKKLNENYNQ